MLVTPSTGWGASGVSSITQIANTTSTTATITAPPSINAGDLLVLWDYANSQTISAEIPPGFQWVYNDTEIAISYKICDGTEDGSTITGVVGSGVRKIISQYRGNVPITKVTAVMSAQQGPTTGDPSVQTIPLSGKPAPMIAWAVYASTGAVTPRTFSFTADHEYTGLTLLYIKDKIYNTAQADVTVDMGDNGTNYLISGYFTFQTQTTPVVSFIEGYWNTAASNSSPSYNVNLGPTHADRKVFAILGTEDDTNSANVGTPQCTKTTMLGYGGATTYYWLSVAETSSLTAAFRTYLTAGGNNIDWGMWRVQGLDLSALYDYGSDLSGSVLSVAVDVPAGGYIFAICDLVDNLAPSAATWSANMRVSRYYRNHSSAYDWMTGYADGGPFAASTQTVTCTNDANYAQSLWVCSFPPS